MRLSRFFIDAPLSLGEHDLPEAQAHYIGRVLRMAPGDAVQLFDGSGQEYLGELLEVADAVGKSGHGLIHYNVGREPRWEEYEALHARSGRPVVWTSLLAGALGPGSHREHLRKSGAQKQTGPQVAPKRRLKSCRALPAQSLICWSPMSPLPMPIGATSVSPRRGMSTPPPSTFWARHAPRIGGSFSAGASAPNAWAILTAPWPICARRCS